MAIAASRDRRTALRHPAQPEDMVEFNIAGYPVYQLKLQNVSQSGAGVIVRPDSQLLTLIHVDQQLKVKLLSRDSQLAQGIYQFRIAHITESKEGRYKGHMVVGIELLEKVPNH
jgi:hypothetical protein